MYRRKHKVEYTVKSFKRTNWYIEECCVTDSRDAKVYHDLKHNNLQNSVPGLWYKTPQRFGQAATWTSYLGHFGIAATVLRLQRRTGVVNCLVQLPLVSPLRPERPEINKGHLTYVTRALIQRICKVQRGQTTHKVHLVKVQAAQDRSLRRSLQEAYVSSGRLSAEIKRWYG